MFDGLFVLSLVDTCVRVIKESFTPTIPAENWANKELHNNYIIDGVSIEQCMKNLENGKYKLTEVYSKPHRDPVSCKIMIENCLLFEEDKREYGVSQAYKWVEQGKYNLSPEELKKEKERIKAKYGYLYSI
jgi:hypothetical protein